jgi:hypothetical protein
MVVAMEPSVLNAMTVIEHDKLLTKCQILEKETVARAKKAEQRPKAESKKAKHNGDL